MFSKSFPISTDKYTKWEDVSLSEEEEIHAEGRAREKNISIMKECIRDAKKLVIEEDLKEYQTDIINIAISFFEKRASHQVYWKERECKEKFDGINKKK